GEDLRGRRFLAVGQHTAGADAPALALVVDETLAEGTVAGEYPRAELLLGGVVPDHLRTFVGDLAARLDLEAMRAEIAIRDLGAVERVFRVAVLVVPTAVQPRQLVEELGVRVVVGQLALADAVDLPGAVAAHEQGSERRAADRLLGPGHPRLSLDAGDVLAYAPHLFHVDLQANLIGLAQDLGIVGLDGLAADEAIAVGVDIFGVFRPDGGESLGVLVVEGLGKFFQGHEDVGVFVGGDAVLAAVLRAAARRLGEHRDEHADGQQTRPNRHATQLHDSLP